MPRMDSLPVRFRKEVFEPYLDLLRAEFRIHRDFDFIREIWERDSRWNGSPTVRF